MANHYDNENGKGNTHRTEYCVLCRRPDTSAGKMIHLPGNLCVCPDCMQKMMDFAGNMDLSNLSGDPAMIQNMFRMFGNPAGTPGDPGNAGTTGTTGTPGNAGDVQAGTGAGQTGTGQEIRQKETPTYSGTVEGEGAAEETEESLEDREDHDESDHSDDSGSGRRGPSISFLNLGDIFGNGGGFGSAGPKVKKKKKRARKPVFSIDHIPAPHRIKEELDKYVIGQERAKKFISVAAYNHYKRVRTGTMDEIEIEKSNILLIGPTGCGKTYLVRTLAELLDVPLAISDATSLTEAGYIGDDIESVISKLLAAADNDVEKAEKGIVFIDEIDKIAKKRNTSSRDVSGESVQQGLLKLLEGAEVEVPVGASSKNAMVPLVTVNTRNILFICGGAFPNLETIIRERLQKQTSMGFGAQLKDAFDDDRTILDKVTNEDLRRFGMIPEFIGRLPILCTLQGLDEEMLVRILREPRNAILRQYQKLLALDEVDLRFEDDALEAIAAKALERDTGARALRSVIEEFMMDIMYEIPKDDNIGTVTITRAFVEGRGGPVIGIRSETPRQIAMDPAPVGVPAET
ncbi:MAG: ATP-dependent Clp protease ATP-binding subunit ClpX [Eubacteriales bacterium]|nr:ATP-dependent Clp protease ATP-binding subunit ClpX [Eubacteriales bacterium]